jgi:hypothetical protein
MTSSRWPGNYEGFDENTATIFRVVYSQLPVETVDGVDYHKEEAEHSSETSAST